MLLEIVQNDSLTQEQSERWRPSNYHKTLINYNGTSLEIRRTRFAA